MFRWILVTIATAALAQGREIFRNGDMTENVNSRYTVESVEVLGFAKAKLSRGVRDRLDKMVGAKYDTLALTGIVWRIREEVRARHIHVRVGRGAKPQHLAVRLEVEGRRDRSFDVTSPKFGYHSRQGFSGAVEGVLNANGDVRIAMGFTNDGDLLLERYQGFHGRAEVRIPKSPVTMAFRYASLGQTWSPAAATSGRYGNRELFEPTATINLARGLDWSSGVSIQRLNAGPAARRAPGVEPLTAAPLNCISSNAVVHSLRYRRRFEGTGAHRQELEAGYDLRAATRNLSSDFAYLRHMATGAYTYTNGRHQMRAALLTGVIKGGDAPLFDRFVLGNSQTLRGYDKFAIAPNGARRIAHGSVDYRYRLLHWFYDVGAIAEAGLHTGMSETRHSLGVGLRKDALQLAVAFPLRGVRMDPVFLMGVNF